MLCIFWRILFLFTYVFSLASFANEEAPQTFTLDGRLYSDAAATLPLADLVSLKIQILDPAQTCLVYEETQSVNTTTTAGYYTIQIGQKVTPPAGKRSSGDSNNGLATIFSNTVSSIVGKLLFDGATSCTYNPAAGDTRYVKFTMTPSGDNIARTTTSNLRVDSVPMALVAERAENLRGLTPSQLLQVNGTTASLTQANLENIFSTINYPNLVSLLATSPTNYVLKNSNGSTNIPSVAGSPGSGLALGQIWYDSTNNQLKYYDGAVKVVGSSTAGTLAATAGGTGQSSFVVGDLLFASSTTALSRLPASTSGYVLTSGGAGAAPSWQAASSGSSSLSAMTAATTTNSMNNANFAQTWTWDSATTESPMTMTANALTTGSLLNLTTSSAAINSTNGLLNVANTSTTTTGTLASFQANSVVGSGMTILNNGNVGIGTTTPTAKLEVIGTSVASGTAPIGLSVVGGNTNSGAAGTGGAINLAAGGRTSFSSGGILNLAGGNENGGGGAANLTGGTGGNGWTGGSVILTGGTTGSGSTPGSLSIGGGVFGNNNGTNISITAGAKSGTGSDGNILLASARGNVGIGTTTPTAKLHVVGTTGTATSPNGNGFTAAAGAGYSSGNGNGGGISLSAGAGSGTGVGGSIALQAGAGVGSPNFSARGNISIVAGDNGGSTGGDVFIRSGLYSNTGSASLSMSGSGSVTTGSITLSSGAPSGVVGNTGALSFLSPDASVNGNGGNITFSSGNGSGTGTGGAIALTAGNGGATNVNGSNVTINPGAAGGTGAHGNIVLANLRGRVGIGTASPSSALHVVGTLTVIESGTNSVKVGSGNATSANSSIAIGINNSAGFNTNSTAIGYANNSASGGLTLGRSNTSTESNSIAIGDSNNASALGSAAFGIGVSNSIANSLMIGPSNTAKLMIDSSGNLGVANTAPANLLHVGSSSVGTGLAVASFQNVDGTCTITPASSGSGIACSSDERLKENFQDVTGDFAIEQILKLQSVTYNFKTSSIENRRTGYKAQEVQKIAPEFVRENEEGLLQVYYDAFIPWITEAIKTLYLDLQQTKNANTQQARLLASVVASKADKLAIDQITTQFEIERAKKDLEIQKLKEENAAIKARLLEIEKKLK